VISERDGALDELLLRRVGYIPSRPKRKESVLPLLGQHEATFATCYDTENNWYTIATGAAAAKRMWEDNEPASSLLERLSVNAEDLPEDIKDLTVVTAEDDLFPVTSNSDGTYTRHEASISLAGQGNRREARTIDSQTRKRYLHHLGNLGLNVYYESLTEGYPLTVTEIKVLYDAFTACRNSLASYASY